MTTTLQISIIALFLTYVLLIAWGLFWLICYRRKKRDIENNPDMPSGLMNKRISKLYRELVKNHLMGFSFHSYLGLLTNMVIALTAIIAALNK